MTRSNASRGRYASFPGLPYIPRPGYPGHNSSGWKGGEFPSLKPRGVRRVVCLGASTTYGGERPYPEIVEELLRGAGIPAEVINAGVPGWTSREVLINLRERVLPLRPDLLILYIGRNDCIPQAFNNYRPDYSHFRDPGRHFTRSNYTLKRAFRVSHLLLLLVNAKPDFFGWDRVAEHPVYSTVQWQNRPTPMQIVANLRDPSRSRTFHTNVDAIVSLAQEQRIPIVVSTFAFLPERLKLEFLPVHPMIFEPMRVQLERNNMAVREVAERRGVPLVDGHLLSEHPEVFTDDCHVTDEGHMIRARMFVESIIGEALLD